MPKTDDGRIFTLLDLGGRKLRLFLRHEHLNNEAIARANEKTARVRARTTARLETEDGDEAIEETSHCSTRDQFRRKTGLRIALSRLLGDPLTRGLFPEFADPAVRAAVWNRVWNVQTPWRSRKDRRDQARAERERRAARKKFETAGEK